MSKFQDFNDLFDFNRELMDDDYNDGQLYVVKHKKKAGSVEFATTVKVSDPKSGESKLAVEEKLKCKVKEFGGWQCECKIKNNGDLAYEVESDALKGIEGLEEAQILLKGTFNDKMVPPQVGFEFDNKDIKSKTYLTASSAPKFSSEFSWRACSSVTIAEKTDFDVKNAKETLTTQWGLAGHFEKSLQYGALMKFGQVSGSLAPTASTLYFNHTAGGNTAGCQMDYDYGKKAFATKLGLKMKEDDHTWKVKFHDTGLARAALQWQLHKAVKATVTSQMNLKDIPAGKVGALPVGLSFELKY